VSWQGTLQRHRAAADVPELASRRCRVLSDGDQGTRISSWASSARHP
jgi:hypothetical protein